MGTTYFDHREDDCSSEHDNHVRSNIAAPEQSQIPTEEAGHIRSSNGGGCSSSSINLETDVDMMDIAPCDGGTPDHAGGEAIVVTSGKSRVTLEITPAPSTREGMIGRARHKQEGDGERPTTTTQDTTARPSCREKGEGRVVAPWAVSGALLSSLSASADALSTDGSKAVRAKALACSLRILEVHGSTIRSGGSYEGAMVPGDGQVDSDYMTKTLCAVR